jgi:hypothetical protein
VQAVGPLAHVVTVEPVALNGDHAEHIVPLLLGDFAAAAAAVEPAEDDVFGEAIANSIRLSPNILDFSERRRENCTC